MADQLSAASGGSYAFEISGGIHWFPPGEIVGGSGHWPSLTCACGPVYRDSDHQWLNHQPLKASAPAKAPGNGGL